MVYYSNVDLLVRYLAADAESMIDVGARDARYIEEFDWISDRRTLDIQKPYSSENVVGIKEDFFIYSPEKKFDFVLCLQVLEHITDAPGFAQKLMKTGRRLIVSVPYKWPKGACKHHVQDPVDEKKLSGWFGRDPDYSIVVQEPLTSSRMGRRLIAYFHDEPQSFDMKALRNRATA